MKSKRRRLNHRALRWSKSIRQRLFLSPEPAGPLCCFLAGHQRSGTNMVMDVLEQHWMADVFHENDPRAFHRFEMREPQVIQHLLKRSQSRVMVVKSLCELDYLDELLAQFTPSRAIWVVRHYTDVTNSMVRSFSTSARWYQAIREDRSAGGWRSRNLSDRHYEWVRECIDEDVTEQSAAALQWAIRNDLFFEKGFDRNERVLLTRYENLVSQPDHEFSRIHDFLNLPLDEKSYATVFPSSVGKESAPQISASVQALCESVWHKFSAIEPVADESV